MYNGAWCKGYINAPRHGEKQKGYRIFLSGPGGTGKSHIVHLIQRDLSNLFKHTVKPDDDQPIVLITAPQQDQQHFKLVDLQSILHFYYMIILNQILVRRRELRCN